MLQLLQNFHFELFLSKDAESNETVPDDDLLSATVYKKKEPKFS